jgi:hypothetical protein
MTWDELPTASYGVCEVMSACIMWCCEVVRTQGTASLFGCTQAEFSSMPLTVPLTFALASLKPRLSPTTKRS